MSWHTPPRSLPLSRLMVPLFAALLTASLLPLHSGAAAPIQPQASKMPAVLYVAPYGDDSWSGKFDQPDPSHTDGPLRTLEHARDVLRKRGVQSAATVYVRGGVYELTQPLVFTPQDSGAPNAPVVYTGYRGETAVLSGGRQITGWTPGKDGVWAAPVPEAKKGSWYFHELFVNGERRQRARTPNTGYFYVQGQVSPQDPATFRYRGDDIRPEWAKSGDV